MNKALCIGISKYTPPDPPLPGVANDVREVAVLLSGDGGAFGKDSSVITDEEATRSGVLSALEAVFDAEPPDTVFVYLAGHGMAYEGRYYFVPHGMAGGLPESAAVPLTTVQQLFDACPARRTLLFLDCCHAGGVIARRSGTASETTDRPREVLAREIRITSGEGKMIYAACTELQSALECSALEHGYFTYALLEGIRGAAANPEGEVTANALFDHIAREVERSTGRTQQPMQFGQMTGRMVLVHDIARANAASSKKAIVDGKGHTREIDGSGSIVMIGDSFFDNSKVQTSGDEISIVIPSSGSTTNARLSELELDGPQQHNMVLPYAHLNSGGDARVVSVRSVSDDGRLVWTIGLHRESSPQNVMAEVTYSDGQRTYTPLDIAVRKARRVLLGERGDQDQYEPGQGRPSMSFDPIAFGGDEQELIDECPVRDLPLLPGETEIERLRRVRLRCVYLLRQLRIVKQVTELRLGLPTDTGVAVTFSGLRAEAYSNVPKDPINVVGTCRTTA